MSEHVNSKQIDFEQVDSEQIDKASFDTAKVWFVGAGPGDKSLITLKGYQLLQQAQVVIYAGSLINRELLTYCRADTECHDSARLTLSEITALMVNGVKAGKLVVRLQTGDLSLFGSIREQAEELANHDIGFVSVPGVSSFLGAAAQLGVEYTVPEVAQSLIITRMEGRTPMPPRETLEAFAAHQTSMAIFLSVQNISQVVARLIQGGYEPQTPVAVVYKATWPDCQIVRGTLETIAEQVRSAGIRKTALILVGAFLGEEYHYSKLYDARFSHEYRSA
ncbi:cobalt-precorrin-4 methyltransferase [Xenorhabdus sp. XENO-10]|uniref:Cobalt-precorrin-4 methyltransferase n=1 Tax=Xenorhabdus yunnanensis TaxID=3025878 RepID=A0ABT5LAV1_9GAMM|nr:cobalt-precorrin-4 methyltransferase [Xenorhabdus yunnanensis]MDC9588162.1 cobalt-precorrin-4 methyltransferase [Xenorhabdus yunnanensis]